MDIQKIFDTMISRLRLIKHIRLPDLQYAENNPAHTVLFSVFSLASFWITYLVWDDMLWVENIKANKIYDKLWAENIHVYTLYDSYKHKSVG